MGPEMSLVVIPVVLAVIFSESLPPYVSTGSIFTHWPNILGRLWGRLQTGTTSTHAWKGDRHVDLYQLHQKYGDVVRYGPNRISINTDVALHEIYGAKCNVQKSKLYRVFGSFFGLASSGSIIDKVQHGSRRRIVGQALTVSAVKSMEGYILDKVQNFCHQLVDSKPLNGIRPTSSEWSAAKNMTDWVARLTINIIGGLLNGQAWYTLSKERKRAFLDTIPSGTKGFLMAGHMPAILTLRMDRIFLRGTTSRARRFEALVKWLMEKRLGEFSDNGFKKDDMFEKLLGARDNSTGAGLTVADLQAEAMTFMVAGSDTMATTMTATLFYLLHYPSTYERLRKEIDNVFRNVEDIIIGPKLNHCIYLRACLDETLRLNPPVGGILPREVLKGGATVDGNFFPEGTDVGTSLYALQRQERYFRNALLYEPERFVEKDELNNSGFSVANHPAFAPFSLGPRGCPAKAMSYAEMMVTLARMVFALDIRLDGETSRTRGGSNKAQPPQFRTNDFFVSTHDGPMVQFRERKRLE